MNSYTQLIRTQEAKTAALGFDYAESRMSESEMVTAEVSRLAQYNRGILTGGEFDCVTLWCELPWNLYDRMVSVC